MLRNSTRSIIQRGVEAQGVGRAGHVGTTFPLTNEELARIECLEDEKTAVEKDAIKYTSEAVDVINGTKISVGKAVFFSVGGDISCQYYMPSLEISFFFKAYAILWVVITAVMAMANLARVRRNFDTLYPRNYHIGLRATHLLRTLEADIARGGLDPDLRIRLASLREENFARPGKQVVLHFFIVVLCMMGVFASGMLIDAAYEIAKAWHES